MSCADCDCINVGDVVEHKMNTSVFGIVIGIAGSLIYIRTSPTLAVLSFHEWELQLAEDDELPPTPAKSEEQPSNVIAVDFTKPRDLRKSTKTAGEA